MESADINVLVALIEGNEQYLQMLVDSGMSWWVSSVAFCAAVVVAVWLYRDNVAELYSSHRASYRLFMSFVLVFFLSVVGYGLWMIRSVIGLRDQLTVLLAATNADIEYSYFEFTSLKISFVIGTSSFIILCLIWIVVWIAVSKDLQKNEVERSTHPNKT